MKAEDKQNSTPNKQPSLFSNPFISAKINPPNKPLLQKQPNIINVKHKNQEKYISQQTCPQHLKQFSNIFCVECLSYNLCRSCISATHYEHEVMQFQSRDQLINQTKQILLENLEETLKDLKSKENEVKNRSHEANLIRNSLRTLQQQIIGLISILFKEIEGKLLTQIQKTQQTLNTEIDKFFKQLNQTNDELRDNLMKILDGNINPFQFNKQSIKRQAPQYPNFLEYKTRIQKHKKIFKDLKFELQKVKNVLQKSSYVGKEEGNGKPGSEGLRKLDKYIESYNYKGEKVNKSLMRTLKLMEMPNWNQNQNGNGNGKENQKFNILNTGGLKAKYRKVF